MNNEEYKGEDEIHEMKIKIYWQFQMDRGSVSWFIPNFLGLTELGLINFPKYFPRI